MRLISGELTTARNGSIMASVAPVAELAYAAG